MAGSSFKVTSKVRLRHIQALRAAGADVEVHFDGSHLAAVKPPHFEVGVIIAREKLEDVDSGIAQMFGFFTREVNLTNRVKYEVANYDEDLIDRSNHSYAIRADLDTLANGGVGNFIQNVL